MEANPAFTSSLQKELLIGNHVFVLLDEMRLCHECCYSSFFCTASTSCASKLPDRAPAACLWASLEASSAPVRGALPIPSGIYSALIIVILGIVIVIVIIIIIIIIMIIIIINIINNNNNDDNDNDNENDEDNNDNNYNNAFQLMMS